LCSTLQFNTDHNSHTGKYPQITAFQVKEKYGGLRFYVDGASSEQYAQISFAENLSEHICERCGSTNNTSQTKGWITTLCEDCMKKSENELRRGKSKKCSLEESAQLIAEVYKEENDEG